MARTKNGLQRKTIAVGQKDVKRKRVFWGVDPINRNDDAEVSCDEVDNSRVKKKFRSSYLRLDNAELFKDNNLSKGGQVKEDGVVLKVHKEETGRQPNVICRVESFGRMCQKFDDRRRKWVMEMGFGGLINLVVMHLPRKLCYWLMTRIDLKNQLFISPEGIEYRLSKNQVSWVLGIPNGGKFVPLSVMNNKIKLKTIEIKKNHGKPVLVNSMGIPVNVKANGKSRGNMVRGGGVQNIVFDVGVRYGIMSHTISSVGCGFGSCP